MTDSHLPQFGQRFKECRREGGGIDRFRMFRPSDVQSEGPQGRGSLPAGGEQVICQVRGGGLAVGSGDAHDAHPFIRRVEKMFCGLGHCLPRVPHHQLGQVHIRDRVFNHQSGHAFRRGRCEQASAFSPVPVFQKLINHTIECVLLGFFRLAFFRPAYDRGDGNVLKTAHIIWSQQGDKFG